jgi:hypothetical protein
MQNKFVFYLADYPVSEKVGNLKVAYIENFSFWKRYKHLSGQTMDIPLNLQYHLHIKGEIADQIFEITNPNITEEDFINAGFIKDQEFVDFIQYHENLQ